jgi:hypothetical protein
MEQFIETLWQRDVNQVTLDLLEQWKRQGYVNAELSQGALMLYLAILRNGISASADLFVNMKPNIELFREMNHLFLYGLVGKKE